MEHLKYILLFSLFLTFVAPAMGQSFTEQAAKEELARRGLADQEERILRELADRDIDLNAVDVNDAVEMQRVQQALEEIIADIEREKKEQLSATPTSEINANPDQKQDSPKIDDQEVIEAVKDGATVDEAITDQVRESEEEKLPEAITYGQHIFRSQSVKFYKKSSDAKAPSSYILGPDDKISISIWGLSVYNESFSISDDGFIAPYPDVRIYLSGIRLADAKDLIRSKMSRYVRFRPDDFDVSVLASRTINVNISGEVFNYGNFNLSALNNAFNALVAAGGPNDIGSVRRIQLKRSGAQARTLDVYKYLQDPIVGDDYFLQENDYIYVPVAEKIVTIEGAINRPYKYELLEGETLADLIKFAGGLKSYALTRNIQIQRNDGDEIEIIDVNYDLSNQKNTALKDGDVVTINAVTATIENVVRVEGAVELPGKFAYTEEMKLSDLIDKARIRENAITDKIYLERTNDDMISKQYRVIDFSAVLNDRNSTSNITLQRGDKITILAQSNFVDQATFSVEGEVRDSGEFSFSNGVGLKVSDAIFLSGGLTRDAVMDYAYLYRRSSPDSKDVQYIAIDLDKALNNPNSEENIQIQPNDRLVISNVNQFKNRFFVDVSGEIANPREIQYDPSLTLRDALRLAGGLKLESDPGRVNIYRVDFSDPNETKVLAANLTINEDLSIDGADEFRLQPFDQIIVRKAPDFELLRNVYVEGEFVYPGTYVLTKDNTKITDIIKDAGGVTDEAFLKGVKLYRSKDEVGYIIFDLEEAMKNESSAHNIILQQGDRITLPKTENLVSISGATKAAEVYSSDIAQSGVQTFPFEKNKNAKYYIDKYAGGINDKGDKSRVTVEYPNGEIKRSGRFLFFRTYPKVKPGSKIKVGYKQLDPEQKEKEEKEPIDWGRVLADSVAQATTILSLILLIQNVD